MLRRNCQLKLTGPIIFLIATSVTVWAILLATTPIQGMATGSTNSCNNQRSRGQHMVRGSARGGGRNHSGAGVVVARWRHNSQRTGIRLLLRTRILSLLRKKFSVPEKLLSVKVAPSLKVLCVTAKRKERRKDERKTRKRCCAILVCCFIWDVYLCRFFPPFFLHMSRFFVELRTKENFPRSIWWPVSPFVALCMFFCIDVFLRLAAISPALCFSVI